jgi:hypothetical protein
MINESINLWSVLLGNISHELPAFYLNGRNIPCNLSNIPGRCVHNHRFSPFDIFRYTDRGILHNPVSSRFPEPWRSTVKRIKIGILVISHLVALLLGGVISDEIFHRDDPGPLVIASDSSVVSAADLQGESDLRIKQYFAYLRRGNRAIEGSISGIESEVDRVSGEVTDFGNAIEGAIERCLRGIGVIGSGN